MSTYYNFNLSLPQAAWTSDAVLTRHLERVLLLGEFHSGHSSLAPVAYSLRWDADQPRRALFKEPRAHIWGSEDLIPTKQTLQIERKAGAVDDSYDIDVLRMTEPRIVFIYDTLADINRLPLPIRTQVLHCALINAEVLANTTDANSAFARYLSGVASAIRFWEVGDIESYPTHFSLRRRGGSQAMELDLDQYIASVVELFRHVIICFQGLISLSIADESVVGFGLRSYEPWAETSDGEPFEILGVLSRDCNAKCDFCYVLGNPSNTAIKLQKFTNRRSGQEAETRLQFFLQGRKLPIPTYDTEEITTHPQFLSTCQWIRSVSGKCISVTTNGYRLNDATVARLKNLSPIDISLSLNAVTPSHRQSVMGGAHARGLAALEVLDRHKVPCAVTVAAWPRIPLAETEAAIRYADKFNVRSISVLLGGYTKLFPNPPEYKIPDFWIQAIQSLAPLRSEIETPLIIQPRLFEENFRYGSDVGRSIITGINKYSPAKAAGLQLFDEIIAVNGRSISTRNECLSLLALLRKSGARITLEVARKERVIQLDVNSCSHEPEYLYGAYGTDRYGIHLIGENIPLQSIRAIYEKVAAHKARKVLIATSIIVRPFAARLLNDFGFLSRAPVEFDLQVVPNKFLGGNIIMGDMLVVDDFMEFIDEYLGKEDCDLILIPSGPFNHGGWWRDMKGQPFELLRRSVPLPVEMVETNYFE